MNLTVQNTSTFLTRQGVRLNTFPPRGKVDLIISKLLLVFFRKCGKERFYSWLYCSALSCCVSLNTSLLLRELFLPLCLPLRFRLLVLLPCAFLFLFLILILFLFLFSFSFSSSYSSSFSFSSCLFFLFASRALSLPRIYLL